MKIELHDKYLFVKVEPTLLDKILRRQGRIYAYYKENGTWLNVETKKRTKKDIKIITHALVYGTLFHAYQEQLLTIYGDSMISPEDYYLIEDKAEALALRESIKIMKRSGL